MRLAQNLMNDGSTMELLRCGSRQLADFASAITKFVESGGERALRCRHNTTRCLFPEEERSTKYDDNVVGKVLRSWALHTSRIDKPGLFLVSVKAIGRSGSSK